MSKYPVVASLENTSQISALVQAPRQIFEIFSLEATTGYLDKKLNQRALYNHALPIIIVVGIICAHLPLPQG